MSDLLLSDFMVRAFLAALVTGLAAPAVGTYLVQRRLSLMGDGIGHVCVTGVALGLLTGTSPLLAAIVIAVLGAVLIEVIRTTSKASGDVALALLFYGGIAGGLVLISLAGQGALALQGYLFGSVTSISETDVWVTAGLAAAVLALCWGLQPQLFAVAHDEDFARTLGLPARAYNVLIAVLAAVSVAVAMRSVGLLLVSALMVIPVAAAQQFSRGFRITMLAAMAFGALASVAGVATSAYVDVPAGPTIVLVALAGFAVSAPVGLLRQRHRQATMPFVTEVADDSYGQVDEPHRHRHGPGCGHPAVEHGDHVDYLHDGHRHAVHGGHYDEH